MAKLEASNCRLKMVLFIFPLLVIALGAGANEAMQVKSLTTEKLVIVDHTGKPRAALRSNAKGDPNLECCNADGRCS